MTPPQTKQTLTINVDIDQSNVILGSLSKLPYETVVSTINSIHLQAQAQLQVPATEASAPVEETDATPPEAAA